MTGFKRISRLAALFTAVTAVLTFFEFNYAGMQPDLQKGVFSGFTQCFFSADGEMLFAEKDSSAFFAGLKNGKNPSARLFCGIRAALSFKFASALRLAEKPLFHVHRSFIIVYIHNTDGLKKHVFC